MPETTHRRLRAPAADGAALVDPPLAELAATVQRNQSLSRQGADCLGLPLSVLASRARAALLADATAFTGSYRDTSLPLAPTSAAALVLAGHQPELFHPGVWFKNFLLAALGQRLGAVAVNLIVDTDVVRKTSIRVPTGELRDGAIEEVAFDAAGDEMPFEERQIRDEWLFRSFPDRVCAAYDACTASRRAGGPLLLERLWKAAAAMRSHAATGNNLGLTLAAARHRVEGGLGLQTLELPLSRVARAQPFRWFALHLLRQLPRLWRVYNGALDEYRHVNHVRSSTHPVPRLDEEDDWLEAPLRIWTKEDPRRRRLFVRQIRGGLELTDRKALRLTLEIGADGLPDRAMEQLAAAEARGVKLRPRALITTMYARLLLSDLFIHGIGGAKYDELTDSIIQRFFGVEPPGYAVATATFRLPLEEQAVTLQDVQRAQRRIRDARYRGEAFLSDPVVRGEAGLAEQLGALAAEKREYLHAHNLRKCVPDVFAQLDKINRAMYALLQPVEEQLRAEHAALARHWKRSQLLASREFSCALFPSEILPARLLDLCNVSS